MARIKRCNTVDCTELSYTRSLCHKHYTTWQRSDKFMPQPVIKAGTCLADGCTTRSVGRGLCWKHYRRALRSDYRRATYACLVFHSLPHWLLYLQDHPMPKLTFDDLERPKKPRRVPKPPKNPNAKRCSVPECDDYALCRGVCHRHYEYMHYHGTLPPKIVKPTHCTVDGCNGKRYAKDFCLKHYIRFKRYGTTDLDKVDGRSAKERHGMTASREYRSWASMIQRCYNPKAKPYKYYGGRGIAVCDRWRYSFENFYADMGERPKGKTIHRIELDGNYEPGNCKWATEWEQNRRQRLRKTNTSGYRGVHYNRGAWVTQISVDNQQMYLGRYKTKK